MQSHPLDGNGINAELFKFLHKASKNAISEPLRFRVPDTIVYSSCASFWYCYDESHHLGKRAAKDLDKSVIFKAMSAQKPGDKSDIVCTFSCWKNGRLDVQYMTKPDLHRFLFGERLERYGLLQKFIEPKDQHNDTIQAAWSPTISFAVRRVNKGRVHDKNSPAYPRAATFEGPSHLSEELFCNEGLRKAIDDKCRCLVSQFAMAESGFSIVRLACFFKQDAHDKFWLLYTTSVRVVESGFVSQRAREPEPILLTVHGQRHVQQKGVVLPPSRHLLGEFFTPSASVDVGDIGKLGEQMKAKMERLRKKKVAMEKEKRELSRDLIMLKREAATICVTPEFSKRRTPSPSMEFSRLMASTSSRSASVLDISPSKASQGSGSDSNPGMTLSSPSRKRPDVSAPSKQEAKAHNLRRKLSVRASTNDTMLGRAPSVWVVSSSKTKSTAEPVQRSHAITIETQRQLTTMYTTSSQEYTAHTLQQAADDATVLSDALYPVYVEIFTKSKEARRGTLEVSTSIPHDVYKRMKERVPVLWARMHLPIVHEDKQARMVHFCSEGEDGYPTSGMVKMLPKDYQTAAVAQTEMVAMQCKLAMERLSQDKFHDHLNAIRTYAAQREKRAAASARASVASTMAGDPSPDRGSVAFHTPKTHFNGKGLHHTGSTASMVSAASFTSTANSSPDQEVHARPSTAAPVKTRGPTRFVM